MRTRTLIVFLIAIACGLVAAFMVKEILAKQNQQAVVAEENVDVYEAAQAVPEYTHLRNKEQFEKYFKKVSKPKSQVYKDAVQANDPGFEKRVYGRRVKTTVKEGDLLTESVLSQGEDVTDALAPGETAFTIKMNPDHGVAGFIFPKDRVDIWATVTRTTGGETPYAELILEDVEVLAINQELEKRGDGKQGIPVERITMRLLPDEVGKVAAYSESGTLRLAKRQLGDKKKKGYLKVTLSSGATLTGTHVASGTTAAAEVTPTPRPTGGTDTPKPEVRLDVMQVWDGTQWRTYQFAPRASPEKPKEENKGSGQ